ncbi:unnamed protein product [Rotaria socialis]|uniref:Uncharacterized protein n=2 Tax=Rotaria socialis TaxID=392032 RepID=A0A820WLR4_9BILA|nr:unnamed protein product [Rotaria socialis]CAF4602621.1 unnamed protein product [Rotaria socialis]
MTITGIAIVRLTSTKQPAKHPIEYNYHPRPVAIGDFNNDAWLDIAVAFYAVDSVDIFLSNSTDILFGNNNDSFTHHKTFSTGFNSYPIFITAADFDNDDQLDAVVVSQSTLIPYSVTSADFNHDKVLNLVVTGEGANNIFVLLGINDGTFENSTIYTTGSFSSTSAAVGDFNKVSTSDTVVVSIAPSFVAMDDFNNDRQVDIIGANTVAKNVAVLLGHKDGSFTIEATYQTGLSAYYVAMGDFNCDSRLDITVANEDDGNIGAIFGYVNFTFRNHATLLTGDRSRPSSFAIADLNHDQQKDIIVTNSESNSVGVFLGFGNGSFASRVTYSTGSYSYPRHVAIYDFNNDLLLDIAVANYSRNNIGILRGQGNGTFLETPHPFILFMKFL